jgi:hypothetical protein
VPAQFDDGIRAPENSPIRKQHLHFSEQIPWFETQPLSHPRGL